MIVISKISADFTRQGTAAKVNAVQGDGNTRQLEIALLSNGARWEPPAGVEASIAYRLPDGCKGQYNQMADGTPAVSISGNVATVTMAPQMLTIAGDVQTVLIFNDPELNRLTTIPFTVSVVANPAVGSQKTEDYIRLQWLEDKLAEYIAGIGMGGGTEGDTGGCDLDEEAVRQIVADYLAENPPESGGTGGGASLNVAIVDGVLCLTQSGNTYTAEIVDDVLVLK